MTTPDTEPKADDGRFLAIIQSVLVVLNAVLAIKSLVENDSGNAAAYIVGTVVFAVALVLNLRLQRAKAHEPD